MRIQHKKSWKRFQITINVPNYQRGILELDVIIGAIGCHQQITGMKHVTAHSGKAIPVDIPFIELRTESIGYIFAVRSSKSLSNAGLTDVHNAKALSKVPANEGNAMGVCPGVTRLLQTRLS